ncbi:MAG: hypothetical protein ACRENU_08935, partial [Gemmatimonadaceae bacterium]
PLPVHDQDRIVVMWGENRARQFAQLLYEVTPTDPLTIATAAALLMMVIVALAACVVPARRAMRVDPVIALRAE